MKESLKSTAPSARNAPTAPLHPWHPSVSTVTCSRIKRPRVLTNRELVNYRKQNSQITGTFISGREDAAALLQL